MTFLFLYIKKTLFLEFKENSSVIALSFFLLSLCLCTLLLSINWPQNINYIALGVET